MTVPFQYHDYESELGSNSPIAAKEWQDFMTRRKMLLDTIMNEGSSFVQHMQQSRVAPTDPFGNPTQTQQPGQPAPGQMQFAPRPAAEEDLIGQARFWGIQNPEQYHPEQLAGMIQRFRDENAGGERDLGSRALLTLGMAAEAGGTTSRLIGNLFGGVHELPFAGPALASILGTDKAKRWLYDLSMGAQTFIEGARAAQPTKDQTEFQAATAAGKVIGYAAPAIAAWETIGALGGAVPTAWASQVTSPIARAALQGGLSGTLLEAGSDEPTSTKVFNIGLSVLGGASAVTPAAGVIGGAAIGSGVGGGIGDSPEDRKRHGIEGAIAGAIAGAIPLFGMAALKMRKDMPGPSDASVNQAANMRPSDIDVMLGRGTQQATATMSEQPQTPTGPDYQVHDEPQLLVRSDAPKDVQAIGGGQSQSPSVEEFRSALRNEPIDLGGQYHPDPAVAYDQALQGLEDHLGRLGMTADEIDGIAFKYGGRRYQGGWGAGFGLQEVDAQGQAVLSDAAKAEGEKWAKISTMMDDAAGQISQRTGQTIEDARATIQPLLTQEVRLGTSVDEIHSRLQMEMEDLSKMKNEELQAVSQALKPMDAQVAGASADAISKQNTILESAALPGAMQKVQVTDHDVVDAGLVNNPAGVTIVRGLSNPLDLLKSPVASQVRFVPRGNGQFDALVGNATDQQAKEYQDYGTFSGQTVVTSDGIEGTVRKIHPNWGVAVVDVNGTHGMTSVVVKPEDLLPTRYATPQVQAPELWDQFKTKLLDYTNNQSAAANMVPATSITDPRVTSIMQPQMSEFFDNLGITDHAQRQVLEHDFNRRWVQDVRGLDPEMMSLQDEAVGVAHAAQSEAAMIENSPVSSLEEKADKRGFIWVSRPGEGGTLKDGTNPSTPEINLATDDAAHEFLARMDRALPDLSPASDVPIEAAQSLPTGMRIEPRLTTESLGESLGRTVSELRVPAGGGGGLVPPGGGSAGGAGFFGGGALPPGDEQTLGGQFAALRRSDPRKLHALVHEFQGLLSNQIRYTRYAMLGLETKLNDMGVDMGRAWQHYDALDTARNQAFNEGLPWINEWSDIMRQFPRRLLRDGSVTRFHEIEDPNARAAAWYRTADSHGLKDYDIKKALAADGKITNFMHNFFEFLTGDPAFSLTADREIFRYMPHVRARQAQGVSNPYDKPGLDPNVQFFAEFAREGNMQFRVMDARELGTHMVRAAMFKKFETEPWENLVNSWQDPRIPDPIKNYMLDYARLSRYGYDPSGDLAVRGVQSIFSRVLRTPVTSAEAQHLLNMPITGQYMSMLAGRSSIFFRDAIQPLLALAKVKIPYMSGVYGDILAGAGKKITRSQHNILTDMYQRGLEAGWIERENPNIEAAGIFEDAPEQVQEDIPLTKEQAARRELAARVGDKTYQLPAWLVRPSESNLSTLKWYGRQGQLHRLIVGEAAYRQATDALDMYRKSQMDSVFNRDLSLEIPYGKVADQAFFSSFEPPIQRSIKELVDNGDDHGAAVLFARQVANWSQFKYGRKEMPPLMRNTFGRVAASLGSFTGQFLEGMVSALGNGTAAQRARFLMTVGTVSGLMYELKHLTGWSFDRWAWVPQAFQYTGGPMVEKAATLAVAGAGAMARSQDRTSTPTETEALKSEMQGPSMADYFPYTGYVKSGQEIMNAAQGTNPWEQMSRYAVTGDKGSSIDISRMLDEYGRQNSAPNAGAGMTGPASSVDSYHMPIAPPHPRPTTPINPQDTAQIGQLFHEANNLLGTPFKLGGRSLADGLDCAEFIRVAYGRIGYKLPEGTAGLASAGQPVENFNDIRPGDIILFDVEHWDKQGVDHPGSDGIPDHSAIYAGNGKIIHDTSSGHGVRYDELDSPYGRLIMSGLHSVRRIISNGDPNAAYFQQAGYSPRSDVPRDLADQMTEIFPRMQNPYMRQNAITTSRATNSNGTGYVNSVPNGPQGFMQ